MRSPKFRRYLVRLAKTWFHQVSVIYANLRQKTIDVDQIQGERSSLQEPDAIQNCFLGL